MIPRWLVLVAALMLTAFHIFFFRAPSHSTTKMTPTPPRAMSPLDLCGKQAFRRASATTSIAALGRYRHGMPERIWRSVARKEGACPDMNPYWHAIERHLRASNASAALEGTLSAASRLAQCMPTWKMRSAELEDAVWRISRFLRPGKRETRASSSGGSEPFHRVLHVATEFYPTGGHARLWKHFVEGDRGRSHSLFLTSNRKVPPNVKPANLDREWMCERGRTPLDCAQRLRTVASEYDLVLLHIHPHDAVACVALAAGYDGPPVGFVDHTDHMFWVGTSILDFRLVFREAAIAAGPIRGIDPGRDVLIHLPAAVPPDMSRAEARRALGLGETDIMLVSIAAHYKYTRTLFDLIAPILREKSNVYLFAVGPRAWSKFLPIAGVDSTRVRIQSNTPDVNLLRAAADVHIDSFPFGSFTSAIESGLQGAAVLSLCPFKHAPLWCFAPEDYEMSGESALLVCPSEKSYSTVLRALIDQPNLLRRARARSQEIFSHWSLLGSWTTQLQEAYRMASEIPRRIPRL